MGNGVAVVNSTETPNFCTLDDMELCFKDVQEVWTVDDNGEIVDFKENWNGDAMPAYYYCDGCGTDWTITSVQNQQQAWALAKAHLAE